MNNGFRCGTDVLVERRDTDATIERWLTRVLFAVAAIGLVWLGWQFVK